MVAVSRLAFSCLPWAKIARLCPRSDLILPLALLNLHGCASSAERKTEAMRELESLQAQRDARGPRECRPGTQGTCFDGPAQSAGRGICRDGQRVCDADGYWGPCKYQVLPKPLELCNGVDDDCNGIIDDGFPRVGTRCTVGRGQCQGQGVFQCRADGTAADCNAKIRDASPEICDGLDNDCDGQIDEPDHFDPNERCRTDEPGACAEGRKRCRKGKLECIPLHAPTHEVCNGRDDDCNGRVDDKCSAT